jgi:ATP-dependent DNA helicase RecG
MSFFDTSLEFLKGVGPQRAALLQKELKLFTFGDLIQHYPFRYEDRTRFYRISEVNELMPFVQMKGKISDVELIGDKFKRRLVAYLSDDTGELELVWFQGINWAMQKLKPNVDYVVFGKPSRYGSKLSIAHPEIELLTEKSAKGGYLQPVYPLSEKLRNRYIDNKFIIKLQQDVIKGAISHIRETLPAARTIFYSASAHQNEVGT